MNALAIEMETDPLIHLHHGAAEGRRSSARSQIELAREMLSTMETVTFGGQPYLMEKIVALIAKVLSEGPLGRGRRNGTALKAQLVQLKDMAGRAFPDIRSFVHRAQGLLDLLAGAMPAAGYGPR